MFRRGMSGLIVLIGIWQAFAQSPPHVVFIIGESEYRSEHTMPLIAGELETKYGMRTSLVFDTQVQETLEPKAGERTNRFEGLEALHDADLAVFFLRFRNVPADQLAIIQTHLDAGKPVVAFRTSTHAFRYAPGDELAEWNGFGERVLGAPWIRHYGHESSTDVAIDPARKDHPILRGVPDAFHARSWLYHIRPDFPPADATVLLHGMSVGPGDVPEVQRERNPVAWTYTHPGGGRVFTTTLGHPEDFELDAVRRLAINGIHWALDLPAPEWREEAATALERLVLRDGDKVLFLGNTFVERDIHHGYLETLLALRHPGLRFTFRNMGWSGDTVDVQLRPLNFGTVEDHVRAYDPDVTFIAYGMNESFEGEAGLRRFIEGYASILDYVQEVSREVVLVSPIRHEPLGPPLPDPSEHNAALRLYVDAIARLAVERGCHFVNLFDTFPDTGTPLTENGIHLNSDGYKAIARVMIGQLFSDGDEPWRVAFGVRGHADAPEVSVRCEGTALTHLHVAPDIIRFEARDTRLASTIADAHAPELRIEGLPDGMYILHVDGQEALRAAASAWNGGIALPSTVTDAPAEKLRATVLEKCERYFYRWRAHNGEYIYGRRARTGNGNSGNPQFQDEHAAMDRAIADLDTRIAELAVPQPRSYELRRLTAD